MQTLIAIRHAIAEPGDDDERRALTPAGRKKMVRAARGLVRASPRVGVIFTSPLVRAVETAAIVALAYGRLEVVELDELSPGLAPRRLLEALSTTAPHDTVAIVGHEPDLGRFLSWLLTGQRGSLVRLRKGAACAVDFAAEPSQGAGQLAWALTPRQLRALAR